MICMAKQLRMFNGVPKEIQSSNTDKESTILESVVAERALVAPDYIGLKAWIRPMTDYGMVMLPN